MAELKPTEKSSVSGICKNCKDHTREKLVELLNRVQDNGQKTTYEKHSITVCMQRNETIADHLIANGVTVQEWIPVKERYPNKEDANEFDEVLTFLRNGKRTTYPYYMVNSKSSSFLYWMPMSALPTPPKGE